MQIVSTDALDRARRSRASPKCSRWMGDGPRKRFDFLLNVMITTEALTWKTFLALTFLVLTYFSAEARVKCHDCMDTEKGWCKEATCEDEYCYKANVTFNGKRIIRLGCMPHGKIGCERQHVHFPAIADAAGDFCVCRSDFCNEALPAFADDANYTLLDYFGSANRSSSDMSLGLVILGILAIWVVMPERE